jgi:PAT family beta-lactamase induction signal transducer AmpG
MLPVFNRVKSCMNKRFVIVFILGFSSGLPMALVGSTLQAWFASVGMSVMATAMLSLLSFPYVYRMFWAPIVDRFSLFSLGKRRSWILSMQILLLVGFNLFAWCSPLQHGTWIAMLAFFLAVCSATQDIAIDAHRTEYLPIQAHGLGASLGVFGYRVAMVFSGGMALVIAQYYGWQTTYRLMGFLMIPGMIATCLSPEPSKDNLSPGSFFKAFWMPVQELSARKGMVSILLFIFFYKLGEAFTSSTSGIMMSFLIQGLGFNLDTVGMINKVVGVSAILIGGLFSGLVLMRWSLSKALLFFGILQALTNLFFVILATLGNNFVMLCIAVISDNFMAGMGTTALVAFIMRMVDKRFTATQFSIFVSVASIPRVLSGPISGTIQYYVGWVGLFEWSFVLALCFLPFMGIVRRAILSREALESQQSAASPMPQPDA